MSSAADALHEELCGCNDDLPLMPPRVNKDAED